MTGAAEKQISIVAAALMSKRQDGHIQAPTALQAAQLLGQCGSYHAGMGEHCVLVPVRAIAEIGLDQNIWEKAAKTIQLKPDRGAAQRVPRGAKVYELDPRIGAEFIVQLEAVAGKRWEEFQAIRDNLGTQQPANGQQR